MKASAPSRDFLSMYEATIIEETTMIYPKMIWSFGSMSTKLIRMGTLSQFEKAKFFKVRLPWVR